MIKWLESSMQATNLYTEHQSENLTRILEYRRHTWKDIKGDRKEKRMRTWDGCS
jgi:hypothetical protein